MLLKGNTDSKPKYSTKRFSLPFTCDLDDIKFIDYCFKQTGEPYKHKCLIFHANKGEIILDHSVEEVKEIVNKKIVIKGFRR